MMDVLKWVPLLILVVLILILLIGNIVIVQQSKAYVVERLGAFRAVWGVGLHLKIPFIERVAKKVSLKEKEPRQLMSYRAANSWPKPKVPLAGITGLSREIPQRVTRVFTIGSPPVQRPVHPCTRAWRRTWSPWSSPCKRRSRSPCALQS